METHGGTESDTIPAHMRFPDTEEVTGSIPVSPTHETRKTGRTSKAPCVTDASETKSQPQADASVHVSGASLYAPLPSKGGDQRPRRWGRVVGKSLAWALFAVIMVGGPVLAYGMHQRANTAPVQPTWQQSVVTIDDAATVAAAQAWGAPFAIRYVPNGADITVAHVDLTGAGKAGGDLRGDAEPVVDGDRIVGCVMRLDPVRATGETAAHEFGHCLGLGHLYTAKSRSLMVNGGAEDREHGSATVTDFDRDALAALYAN